MSIQVQSLINENFSLWDSATSPSTWQQTSVTATTLSRLKQTDARNHPARAVFSRGPYVYAGDSSLRATLTAAAVAADFTLRQPNATTAGILVEPMERLSAVVAARCNVNGNLLRVRIIGLVGTTDTIHLEPTGNSSSVATNYMHHGGGFSWITSARDIAVVLHDGWERFGFELWIPQTITGVAIRVGNGTAGAQVIDIGEVALYDQDRRKVQ